MREELVGAAIVSAAILGMLLVAELWRRLCVVPVEWTRKLAHVGAGTVLLAVPWLIRQPLTLAALAVGFLLLLVALKLRGALSSVHGIRRRSLGAYLFPLAAVEAFVSADGAPLRFMVPIAVLAFADSAAALVGQRTGGPEYRFMGSTRTLNGSVTFFAIAFACVFGGLTLEGSRSFAASLVIALTIAVVVTVVEALSSHGADNLLVPLVTGMGLDVLMPLGTQALALVGYGAAVALAVTWLVVTSLVRRGAIRWAAS